MDQKAKKELPEQAFDFLLELWARSHNVEIVSVQKFKDGEHDDNNKDTA